METQEQRLIYLLSSNYVVLCIFVYSIYESRNIPRMATKEEKMENGK